MNTPTFDPRIGRNVRNMREWADLEQWREAHPWAQDSTRSEQDWRERYTEQRQTRREERDTAREEAFDRAETRREQSNAAARRRWRESGAQQRSEERWKDWLSGGRRGPRPPHPSEVGRAEFQEREFRKRGSRRADAKARWARSKEERLKRKKESRARARKSRAERRKAYDDRLKARREKNEAKVKRARDKMKKLTTKQLKDLANNPNAPGWQRRLAAQVLARKQIGSGGTTHEGPSRGPARTYPIPTIGRSYSTPSRRAFISSGGTLVAATPRGGRRITRPTTGGGVTYGQQRLVGGGGRFTQQARHGAPGRGTLFTPAMRYGMHGLAGSEARVLAGLG
jgi:hypothetical protein